MNLKPNRDTGVADLFREHGLSLAAAAVSLVVLTTGWQLFSSRLAERASGAEVVQRQAEQIWGGPLVQPHPTLRWRREDAATSELAEAEVASSNIAIALDVEYRRRGAVEIPAYRTHFSGAYEVVNPSPAPAFIAFSIRLPAEKDALLLHELKLTVNGREEPGDTTYSPDGIIWSGKLDGGSKARIDVAYSARGLERFGYALASAPVGVTARPSIKPVTQFKLAMTVRGGKGQLDYPVGSMAPTAEENLPDGKILTWSVDRLLTQFDVGVILPDNMAVGRALQSLTDKAPWFYLLYAGGLLFALAPVARKPRALHLVGLSTPYFLFFPLATYLAGYLHWAIAAGAAFAIASALSILHVLRFIGRRPAALVAVADVFFLGLPAGAHLVPSHTGLTLVLGAVIAVAIGLHLLGMAARRIGDAPAPADTSAAPAPAIPIAEIVGSAR